jgi:TetR/AcrR family transcriptional repressor of lmrAB and yxaGH operons
MNTTREQIVTAAAKLLEAHGYFGTGLNEVVRVSGAPKGVLYYYFPEGKEQLTAEAITQSAQLLAANMHRELGDAEGAPAAIDAVSGFMLRLADYVEAGACRVGAPIAAVALETAGMSDRLATACHDAYGLLQAVVATRLEHGGWEPAAAASLAAFVIASLEGGIVLARAQRSADVLRQNAAHMRTLLAASQPASPA